MGKRARLALLGDVHANHPALAAVLAAIDAAGITDGVCTGDLVMRGVWPAECIDEIRRRGWPCTMGNTDQKVGTRPPRAPDDPKAKRKGSRSWTSARLGPEDIAFLAALPMVARVEVAGVRVAVMHGSPTDPRDAVTPESPDEELEAIAREVDADVIVMGHVHRQMVRRAGDCLFVNPGAVGEAMDGDLHPRWAWLEVGPDGVGVHLERIDEPLATIRER
jgi:putative phosphoesterase